MFVRLFESIPIKTFAESSVNKYSRAVYRLSLGHE